MADEQVTIIEREPGPSWARPNWPVAELDDINLGLDPTEATIEAVRKASEKAAAASAPAADGEAIRRAAEDSIQQKATVYDMTGDQHYDAASALIKSLRGSDPDAALYWLAYMIEGGEDPRFIARRMAILASEDIGNADPRAIMVAQAAWNLVERIGMPEARITLAQCATYLAMAPKSNASYLAIDEALSPFWTCGDRRLALRDGGLHDNGTLLDFGRLLCSRRVALSGNRRRRNAPSRRCSLARCEPLFRHSRHRLLRLDGGSIYRNAG